MTMAGKLKETFSKWDSERVFSMTSRVTVPVSLVKRNILHCNIGRIPHYYMVLLPKYTVQFRQVLCMVDVLSTANAPEIYCLALEVEFAKPLPV